VAFPDISPNLVQRSVEATYKERSHFSCCAANTGYYPRFGDASDADIQPSLLGYDSYQHIS